MQYVFVDIDGTIAEWGYPDGRISGGYKLGDYMNKKPIDNVIAEIYNLYANKQDYIIFITSVVPNANAIFEKNIWLDKYFNIPYQNRIYLSKEEDKIDVIEFYMKNFANVELKGNSILIDDRKDWLIKGKELGMEVYHPTQIITSFQDRMESLLENNILENNEGEENVN